MGGGRRDGGRKEGCGGGVERRGMRLEWHADSIRGGDSCDDFLRMFNTVVFGSVNLTRAILPHFRERRSGVVVYMGSMWGWEGSAGNSMYCGVKFALEGK